MLLVLGFAPAAAPAAADQLAGTWHGELGQGLRLVLHLSASDRGLIGTLDSPDQGARGIPLGEVTRSGDSLRATIPTIGGLFVARIAGADLLDGEWRQNGMQLPLQLLRGEPKADVRHQEPQGALPYDAREVTIDTQDPGVRLAGTLTVPKTPGPHPAVFLVSGSGPQDRNEEVYGHRPFLVIADHLTRRGIAVLRVDDRGIGGSTGRFAGATTDDFAGDAEACLAWLRRQTDIDAARVGLIGHSEGALIAPIVTSRDDQVAFAVLLAGPGVDGRTLMLDQLARLRLAAGADPASVARLSAQQARIYAELARTGDTTGTSERVRGMIRESIDLLPESERAQIGDPEQIVELQLRQVHSPWFRYLLSHDPRPVLEAVRCPVLALFGSKDLQVAPTINREPMEQALRAHGNPDVEVRVLPGLNHLFQKSASGLPMEYAQIDETFDPEALALMSDWILERAGRPLSAERR
jgi:pimeloyl-ACP methyl ester carboxylesterase